MYCPSGERSHLFQDRKEFIKHLISCPNLNDIIESQGLKKSGLIYQMCPKNFHHLKIAPNQFDSYYEEFCSCNECNNEDYSNLQGLIQFGNNNMNDFFKFFYQMDNIKVIKNQEEEYLYKDFEHQRNQYKKEQSLKNSIQQNRVLYMSFHDSLYDQKVQFTFIKDHIGMKDFIKKHGKIDQQFEIISEDKVQLTSNDLSFFMDHSKKGRIIMEVQITQKNSFRVQQCFSKDNFFTCVQYKQDILLLFRYDIFNNFTLHQKPLYLLKLDELEYIDQVKISKERMKILQSQESCQILEQINLNQNIFSKKIPNKEEDKQNSFSKTINLQKQKNYNEQENKQKQQDIEENEDFSERVLVEIDHLYKENSKVQKNLKQEKFLFEKKNFSQMNAYNEIQSINLINNKDIENLQEYSYFYDENQKENSFNGEKYLKQNIQKDQNDKQQTYQNSINEQKNELLELFEFEQLNNLHQIDSNNLVENQNNPQIKKVTIYKRQKKIINPNQNTKKQQQIINQNPQQLNIKVSSSQDSFVNKLISEYQEQRKSFGQEQQKYIKIIKSNQRIQKYKQILQNEDKSSNS